MVELWWPETGSSAAIVPSSSLKLMVLGEKKLAGRQGWGKEGRGVRGGEDRVVVKWLVYYCEV